MLLMIKDRTLMLTIVSRDAFYGCLPYAKGGINVPAIATGSIDGLFGIIAQTNNFNDPYKNTVAPPNRSY